MKSLIAVLLKAAVFASILPGAVSLYSSKSPVIQITPKNFKEEVLDTQHAVLAEFYAPWCGHCKNLAPEYKKAAEKLKGLAKVVAVDCDTDQNKPLCGQFGVQGFPTIKLFPGGKKGLPQDYNGPRTAKGLVDAIVAKISNNVLQIGGGGKRAVTYDDFVHKPTELPRVVLASKKASTPPLFKALSAEYHNRMVFGEVKSTEQDTLTKLNITDFPSVVVFPKAGDTPVRYTGPMKHASLVEFLDLYAPQAAKKESSQESSKKPAAKTEAAGAYNRGTIRWTVEGFKAQADLDNIVSKPGFTVLAFFILEPDFEESVKAHKENLDLLQAAAKQHPGFRYVWFNTAERGRVIMQDLQVSDSLPGLVVVNDNKKAYRIMTGPFDKDGINTFLKEVSAAQGRFFKYGKLPLLEGESKRAKDEL
ncbi:uncharacterized protein EV422DRAFT_491530 [Fimicolochytrium jonesii]|uniref:uncharacterized protein n=1 Tax=Fimicolochytrium jonesii TaxID=1396493 RepID=UPI0022FE79B4|nr:uncharacterized protein EV422DRAFT_491530 [Fimicolochytrium jonesii]KAI8825631.1 hypothetical protein EV422DRAFT_491530 [Fimicolochytrium jonesii]